MVDSNNLLFIINPEDIEAQEGHSEMPEGGIVLVQILGRQRKKER
jgi:hypothetical protein